MLDLQATQDKLDSVQAQYANGMMTLWEKLHKMVDDVDQHVAAHEKEQKTFAVRLPEDANQYDKAHTLLRQMRHVDKFMAALNFYI